MEGAPPASRPGSDSLCEEFSKAALGSFPSPSWSDLPIDILISILQWLELPQALAFASVCTTWRAAAIGAGVPCSFAPWIMSWGKHLKETHVHGRCSSVVTCNLYHPVDVKKYYGVSFQRVALFFAVEPLTDG
ncbi:hypothetical protein HU200_012001 [Digitaria exilis]|uniref:F-box domain-containing protein n=1 Tax=Digitaria exilis TaxID=1010633 RepID=A0A835FFF8_9POAL|nr:hypothetical protein HU200_012001 [Digitaria exilis]